MPRVMAVSFERYGRCTTSTPALVSFTSATSAGADRPGLKWPSRMGAGVGR